MLALTPISQTAGIADAHAAPIAKARNFSLDRARTFLTLVVLIHHAVIPYTCFGHTDPKYLFGFDMIVLATDINVAGFIISPIAEIVAARSLPFVFVSGYGPTGRPALFADKPVLHKPFLIEHFADMINWAMATNQRGNKIVGVEGGLRFRCFVAVSPVQPGPQGP